MLPVPHEVNGGTNRCASLAIVESKAEMKVGSHCTFSALRSESSAICENDFLNPHGPR